MNEDFEEKYRAHIEGLSSKEILDELQRKANTGSIGYIDPVTKTMLTICKKEILRRIKEGEDRKPNPKKTPTSGLFG